MLVSDQCFERKIAVAELCALGGRMGFKAEIGIQLILARSKGRILGDQFVL